MPGLFVDINPSTMDLPCGTKIETVTDDAGNVKARASKFGNGPTLIKCGMTHEAEKPRDALAELTLFMQEWAESHRYPIDFDGFWILSNGHIEARIDTVDEEGIHTPHFGDGLTASAAILSALDAAKLK